MAKPKTRYVCEACGTIAHRWQGQCADGGEWNTLAEDAPVTAFAQKHDLAGGGKKISFEKLDAPSEVLIRRGTGLEEFDRALGGGIVQPATV